jgi:translation elongation factor EF-1alpha
MSEPIKFDFLGQVIEQGDFVVWAVRQGSSLWLNGGEVLDVFEDRRLRVSPDITEQVMPIAKRTVLLSANAHVVKVRTKCQR